MPKAEYETVHHPSHYNSHPSGIECINFASSFSGYMFVVFKHLWRLGLKPGVSIIEDLSKARFYLEREVERLKPWNQFGFQINQYKAKYDSLFDGDIVGMCDRIIKSDPNSALTSVIEALVKNKNPLDAFDQWLTMNNIQIEKRNG